MQTLTTRSRRNTLSALALAGTLALTACAGAGEASDEAIVLQVSAGVSETHAGMKHMHTWSDRVSELTDGAVTFEYTYGGALLPIDDEIPGVAEGRADMAYGSPHYNTSLLPLTSVGQLPFITRNSVAQVKAAHDLLQENEAIVEEWDKAGVKPLFQVLMGQSLFAADQEVESMEDLKGLRVRAFSDVATSFEKAGATATSIPYPELYESAQRGMIDAISGVGFTGLESGQLYDVASHIHDIGHGEANGFQTIVINKSTYESFDPEIIDAFEQATEEYYEEVATLIEEEIDASCSTMLEAGTEFHVWPEEEMSKWDDIAGEELKTAWVSQMSDQGLPGQEVLEEYEALVDHHESSTDSLPDVEQCITSNQ